MYSVQYLFLYLWPKFLKNTFEVVRTLVFFKENSHSYGKFTQRLLLLQLLYNKFLKPIELLFLVGDRKINKIYHRKLKSGDRVWTLEIIHWKLSIYGKFLCIRQTLQISQFYRVSLADLWVRY